MIDPVACYQNPDVLTLIGESVTYPEVGQGQLGTDRRASQHGQIQLAIKDPQENLKLSKSPGMPSAGLTTDALRFCHAFETVLVGASGPQKETMGHTFRPSRALSEMFVGCLLDSSDYEPTASIAELEDEATGLIADRVVGFLAGLSVWMAENQKTLYRVSSRSTGRFSETVAKRLQRRFSISPYRIADFLMALHDELVQVVENEPIAGPWGRLTLGPAGLLLNCRLDLVIEPPESPKAIRIA